MNKKGIKKYQDAANSLKLGTTYGSTGGWNYGFGQDKSGMVNPGNAALKQYTTTSSSTIPTDALPTSGDISQVAYTKDAVKGPSFKDKAGAFMGNYGGAITQAAGTLMPLLMKKKNPNEKPYKKGTKLIKYQGGTNAADIIGPGPLDNLPEMSPKQMQDFINYDNKYGYGKKEIDEAIERVNRMGAPISPLTLRMASIPTAQIPTMSPKMSSNVAPVQKQSRRERKEENRRLERMARAPITYNENSFIGPSNEELQLGRLREDAQSARNTYEARLAGESARSAYEAKQKGTPMTDALFKSVISSQAFKETMTPKKSLKTQYEENKGGYARALKSGKRNAQGNLVDPTTGLEYKDLRTKSSNKSSNQSSVPPAGQELVRMSRIGENPLYNKSVGVPEPIKRNYPKKIDKENFQPIGLGEKYQAGTKSLTKDEGKVGKGSEYFALAKTLTPEQKAEFRKLDAQAKKEGKTFSFQGLKYDPAAYAAAMSKGKGASKGSAKADTPKTAQHTTDDPGKKMITYKKKGDDTNIDETIEFISRVIGGIGGSALGGLSSFGLAVPLGAIAGDYAGKNFANWLNTKLGYREEDDDLLADYSAPEAIMAGVGGKYAKPVFSKAGTLLEKEALKNYLKKLNPEEALEYIKNLWKNKIQMKPILGSPIGKPSGKLSSKQGFNQNPLQTY